MANLYSVSIKTISVIFTGIFFAGTSYAQTEKELFKCVTEKHTIIISEPAKGTYQYRSWNKPKAVSDKPDMYLKSKGVSVQGSGVCRYTEYSFKTGKVEFLINDDITCLEGKPPENIVGNLNILVNGELKNHYFCFKH